ncbi:helix-turn-helix domain-containing protein [Spongiimicrobium salis]|uniref:helix-turn-helix domain-containing protein n=1 Tax=Spongiimicrobium salis TaxID=1667022 RepID=UPI00374DC672
MTSLGAQTTFVLEKLPENTPENNHFFLSGSFNKWNASDAKYQFHKGRNGKYYAEVGQLQLNDRILSFLITRGSWETVESEIEGWPRITRRLSYVPAKKDTVFLSVLAWSDLDSPAVDIPKVKIVLENLPRSTPPDAPIYITGNFNGWIPGDTRYRFNRDADGVYGVDIPAYWSTLEYKFTRGNWHTVEGKAYGRPILDRITKLEKIEGQHTIVCTVSYWEDQSSGLFNPYTLILLLAAFQGILILIIVNTYENRNKKANKVLSLLIGLISIALLTSVAIYDRDVYNAYPKISLLPDFVYFLYAPLFAVYIERLLKTKVLRKLPFWMYFIPFGIHLIAMGVFFFEPVHLFVGRNLSPLYSSVWYIVIGGVALLFNVWVWFKIRNTVRRYLKNAEAIESNDPYIRYFNKILFLKGICLALWLGTYLVGAIGLILDHDLTMVTDFLVDIVWVVFSFTVFLLGYFAIRQPEIFKIEKLIEEVIDKSSLDKEDLKDLKAALEKVMQGEKLFLQPTLSLPELATTLGSNVHELSKVINEGFDKNFRDFVNSYRIAHFIEKVKAQEDKSKTYLAIALDSGFNSKSSFNRSFKKIKGTSPREFFQGT